MFVCFFQSLWLRVWTTFPGSWYCYCLCLHWNLRFCEMPGKILCFVIASWFPLHLYSKRDQERNLGGFFSLKHLILLADVKTYLENYSDSKINNNCMQAYLAAQQDLFLEKDSALFLLHFRFRVYLHLRHPEEFQLLFQSFIIDKFMHLLDQISALFL